MSCIVATKSAKLSRLLRTTPLSDSKKTNNKEASNTLCRQVDELILLKVSYNHYQKHHNGLHEGRFHCVLKAQTHSTSFSQVVERAHSPVS